MKKLNLFLAILLSLTFVFTTACAGGEDSTGGANSAGGEVEVPSHGEEPWLGEWERPDMPDNGGNGSYEYVCEHKCFVCGKCISMYSEESACEEKCYEANGRELYTFNATDPRVDLKGGVSVEGDHIGNINNNANAQIIMHVTAPEETVVCLGATISEMNEAKYVTSNTEIFVNNEKYISRGYLEAGPTTWTTFKTVWLGCVTLHAGDNEIKFSNPNSDGQQFNFKDFSFLSPVELTWTTLETHECASKDANGKCTDYTCNKKECLDKNEDGWKRLIVQGGDEKVLKYGFSRGGDEFSLWNASEGCIGNIANNSVTGYHDQTIIFSLNATEETFVRLSLNMSTHCAGTSFSEMFEITLNGEEIVTEGVTGKSLSGSGWGIYVDGTVAYLKLSAGDNTIIFRHKHTNAGDNVKYMTVSYQNGTIEAIQAEKPQS